MTSEETRRWAEERFKQKESAQDGRKTMSEYESRARDIREKTERLRALRLMKEAQAENEEPSAKPTGRRVSRRDK